MSHGAIFPGGTSPGGVSAALPVAPTDDGASANSSGSGGTTHTWSSKTSTGPKTIISLSYEDGSNRTVSSVTFDGNAMSLLAQDESLNGVAIYIINGAQSGDVVVTYSGTVKDSHITIISLENLLSEVARDTDSGTGSGTGGTLSALVGPGSSGIVIAVFSHADKTAALTFGNITERDDIAGAENRHGVAWDLGNPLSNITCNSAASSDWAFAAVSLR